MARFSNFVLPLLVALGGARAHDIFATAPLNSTDHNETTTSSSSSHLHVHSRGRHGCGTQDPTDVELLTMDVEIHHWEEDHGMTGDSSDLSLNASAAANVTHARWLAANKRYTIPVFFNVLALSLTEGVMTDASLRQTIKAMNFAYRNTNFQFVLQGVQRRTGSFWYNCSVNNQDQWKGPLYIGASNALNIYYCNPTYLVTTAVDSNTSTTTVVPTFGSSSWPTNANNVIDGIVIPHNSVVPGAQQQTIHKSGHWMGLLHTFAGGCTAKGRIFEGMVVSDGDGVDDTPAHAAQTLDIVAGIATCWQNMTVDTCADSRFPDSDPGQDPVTNYMNFIKPRCWAEFGEFTPGQAVRMLAVYEQFRLRNPWRCKSAGGTCRESFECCGGKRATCVKAAGQVQGKCTMPVATACKKVGTTCSPSSACCSGLACNSGVCRAPTPGGDGGGIPPRDDGPDCISILCRSQPVKKRTMTRMRTRGKQL